MGDGIFQIIELEREVVRHVDDHREIGISQSLLRDVSTTSVGVDSDVRLFDDPDGVANVGDFTEVIIVSDVFDDRSLTERYLRFLAENDRREIAVGKLSSKTRGGCGNFCTCSHCFLLSPRESYTKGQHHHGTVLQEIPSAFRGLSCVRLPLAEGLTAQSVLNECGFFNDFRKCVAANAGA